MPEQTPNRGYPYPTLDDPNNVPLWLQQLAEKVDVDVADILVALASSASRSWVELRTWAHQVGVGQVGVGQVVNLNVTVPPGRFIGNPLYFATPVRNSSHTPNVWVGASNAATVTVYVRNDSGTAVDILVNLFAIPAG